MALQDGPLGPSDAGFALAIGAIGLWRYGWGAVHLLRAWFYLQVRFPRLRREAGSAPPPPEVYVVVTAFREETRRLARVFAALFTAAEACPAPVTVVALLTDPAEQDLLESLVRNRVRLITLLQDGSGKRAALAEGLRAVSRRSPAADAVVFVMDGDTLLPSDALARCLPFFRDRRLGAVTTDTRAEVAGSAWARDWYMLRHVQRHVLMASMSLSGRLLVLTGRLSAFRAGIATHPGLIAQVERDSLDHWRYGQFRFLTGDDKSTWLWLLGRGWSMLYVPDVAIRPLEHPPRHLAVHAPALMARWSGNMLRANGPALALGPGRLGFFFTWWCLLDQRLSMWTGLSGLAFALSWSVLVSVKAIFAYAGWVLATRLAHAVLLGGLRGRITPRLPLLLYCNQVVGAAVKVYVTFRLNRQLWTRQRLGRVRTAPLHALWDGYLTSLAVAAFLLAAALSAGALAWPDALTATAHAAAPDDTAVPPEQAHRLQQLIDAAPPGATLRLGPGDFRLPAPLIIRRDDIVIAGAGSEATRLVAAFPGQDAGILSIVGQTRPERCGRLSRPVMAADTTLPATGVDNASGFVLVTAANDDAFLDALGATTWRKASPELRRTLARVAGVAGEEIRLSAPLSLDVPAGTRVCPMALRRNVTVRDLAINYDLGARPDAAAYANLRPEWALDGILVAGAADVRIERVTIIDAGRHPLHFDTALAPRVADVVLDGAWNKGPGGNGYLRLARTVDGAFQHVVVRGLRHVALQWGSYGNRFEGLDSDTDVNFHGGFAHHNRVEAVHLSPRPGHPWPPVFRTPLDAAWASPDGPGNVVVSAEPSQ